MHFLLSISVRSMVVALSLLLASCHTFDISLSRSPDGKTGQNQSGDDGDQSSSNSSGGSTSSSSGGSAPSNTSSGSTSSSTSGSTTSNTSGGSPTSSTSGGSTTGGTSGNSSTSGTSSGSTTSSSTSGGSSTSGAATTAYDKLPDTSQASRAVYVISDQPNMAIPTDAEARMATKYFVGTQKMTAEGKAKFQVYNPNWFQLHYRLGAASGRASFIHNDSWNSWPGTEWPTLFATHPEYFLRDASGKPDSYDGGDLWYAHDLSNPNMRAWWIQQTIGDMAANHSDGTFGDSFNGAIGCAMTNPANGGICDPRLQGTGAINPANWPNGYTYAQQLNDWMKDIQAAFHRQPGSPLFIPNLGSLNTEWYFNSYDFADADGAFLESFPDANRDIYDNEAADNYALQLTRAGKVVIIQTYPSPSNINDRLFCVGTYLLIKGTRTYINLKGGGGDGIGFYYWPEFTVALGSQLAPPPANVTSMIVSGHVYSRAYQNGLVLVNGSDSAATVNLAAGKTYYLAIPSGGGEIHDSDIEANGDLVPSFMSLTSQPVTGTVSIHAWSAAILLNSPPK